MARRSFPYVGVLALALVAGAARHAVAQQDAANIGTKLMADAAVKSAVDGIRAAEPQTIEDQIRLCEVEAPGSGVRDPRSGIRDPDRI